MTTILLARHGETDWNRDNRFQGHADPPLNETGRAQAAELSAALADEPLVAVYSSPLRRALETAEIVATPHGLEPVQVTALREVDVGSWQGLTRAEIEERFPEQFARWLAYEEGWEDGESYEEMGRRVIAGLLELAAAHEGERILAVTHGGPVRAAYAFADDSTHAEARRHGPVVANAFVAEFAAEDGNFRRVD
ncbi:MAG: histidine phosphatase family protein [Actinomycetota bacterium]|nr:histidine phosphatase family protein [Actinomycetota bacterium]